jgi:hypothetical protein
MSPKLQLRPAQVPIFVAIRVHSRLPIPWTKPERHTRDLYVYFQKLTRYLHPRFGSRPRPRRYWVNESDITTVQAHGPRPHPGRKTPHLLQDLRSHRQRRNASPTGRRRGRMHTALLCTAEWNKTACTACGAARRAAREERAKSPSYRSPPASQSAMPQVAGNAGNARLISYTGKHLHSSFRPLPTGCTQRPGGR